MLNNKSTRLSVFILALITTVAAAWSKSFADGINIIVDGCPITAAYLKPALAYSSILIPLDILITSTVIYYLGKRTLRL
jgi:hypothetical protein